MPKRNRKQPLSPAAQAIIRRHGPRLRRQGHSRAAIRRIARVNTQLRARRSRDATYLDMLRRLI